MSHKIRKQGILIVIFLLILIHLMMRAIYDIENNMENQVPLSEKICSAALKQGILLSNPYLLYINGSEQNGLYYQFLKGMPLEMCLLQGAEEENQMTEYRQPSVIEEMPPLKTVWPIRINRRGQSRRSFVMKPLTMKILLLIIQNLKR